MRPALVYPAGNTKSAQYPACLVHPVGAHFIEKKGDLFGEEEEVGLNHCVY